MTMPTRTRTPVLALATIALGLLVVGGILLAGRLGIPDTTAAPTVAASPSPSAADPRATPEGTVRAFFTAFATARRSDEPSAIVSFVTGTDSSAYRSVAGFLEAQKSLGKASILTEQRIEHLKAVTAGATTTITFDYTEVGYDISLAAASPLQTPQVLPAVHVTVHLALAGSAWLVDAYESAP